MTTYIKIDGKLYAVNENPSCNCSHHHMLFVKGKKGPHKFMHSHPHKAHKAKGWAFHKHSAAQKASLR